jgi:hypothetical protein
VYVLAAIAVGLAVYQGHHKLAYDNVVEAVEVVTARLEPRLTQLRARVEPTVSELRTKLEPVVIELRTRQKEANAEFANGLRQLWLTSSQLQPSCAQRLSH